MVRTCVFIPSPREKLFSLNRSLLGLLSSWDLRYKENATTTTTVTTSLSYSSPFGHNGTVVVLTWVNGSDAIHLQMRAMYKQTEGTTANRFRDLDELKHTVRSVHKFAPWVKEIIIVVQDYRPRQLHRCSDDNDDDDGHHGSGDHVTTCGQRPTWLTTSGTVTTGEEHSSV